MLACPEKSTIVRTRLVSPDDMGRVLDTVFAGLSARSRYLRFHAPISRLPGPLRRQLADVDGQHRAALVAETGPRGEAVPIGLVELADTGTGAADVALAVVDAWQRRGVGGCLLAAAAELAAGLGYTALRGLVLSENAAMRRLAHREFPSARVRFGGETTEFTVPIGPVSSVVTHEDVLADLLYRGI